MAACGWAASAGCRILTACERLLLPYGLTWLDFPWVGIQFSRRLPITVRTRCHWPIETVMPTALETLTAAAAVGLKNRRQTTLPVPSAQLGGVAPGLAWAPARWRSVRRCSP